MRRIRELKAFDKVFVKAGEEKICSLSLGEEELALWDADMAFRVEPGDFSISLEEGGQVFFTGILTVYLKSH